MAAVTTVLLSLLRAGDHLLASDCLYGGTHDFLTGHAGDLGWRCSFVDVQRPETWAAARTPQTRVFLVETITNPLMRVGLLREIADFARREGLIAVIDNTFASPVNFRPLAARLRPVRAQRHEVPGRPLRPGGRVRDGQHGSHGPRPYDPEPLRRQP